MQRIATLEYDNVRGMGDLEIYLMLGNGTSILQ